MDESIEQIHLFEQFPEVLSGTFLCDVEELENQRRIVEMMGVDRLVRAPQCHGRDVFEMRKCSPVRPCDGLITREEDVALMVTHADCQAAVFYDPVRRVIGAAHAGWKGLVANIYREMVAHFENPGDVWVAAAPSLGPCHAEFVNYRDEFPKEFWEFNVGDDHFDLRAIGRMQLEACGVPEGQISFSDVCTVDREELFSFRRDAKKERNGTLIALKPKS